MPQRAIYLGTIVLGILGLAVIGVLLALRRDVPAAARTGPRWKRRLVGAALAVLAILGVGRGDPLDKLIPPDGGVMCYDVVLVEPPKATPAAERIKQLAERSARLEEILAKDKVQPDVIRKALPGIEAELAQLTQKRESMTNADKAAFDKVAANVQANLDKAAVRLARPNSPTTRPEWPHLSATWRQAQSLAAGEKGPYPFDPAGKAKILADLAKANDEIASLRKADSLTGTEFDLLAKLLADLTDKIQGFRTTEEQGATCYIPMRIDPPAKRGMARLADRLPLLEKLAEQKQLQPEVTRAAVASAKADLAMMDYPPWTGELTKEEKAKARDMARDAAKIIEQIEAMLKDPDHPGGQLYIVKENDTFFSIAAANLGDGKRADEIARMNRGVDPKQLRVGQAIRIPAK